MWPGWGCPWLREVTALCLQLLAANVVNDLMLLESLLDNLAARQKDTCTSVRRLVLRGLANVASGSPEKVSGHSAPRGPAGGGEGPQTPCGPWGCARWRPSERHDGGEPARWGAGAPWLRAR